MSELKACPFCGITEEYELDPIIEIGAYGDSRVRCQCCDSSTNYVGSMEDYTAKMLWNRRPIEDKLDARIAELEAERDKFKAVAHEMISYLKLHGNYYKEVINKAQDALKGKS
ncbi:MAG: hypothetical protein AB7F32_04990 [Victivallaceae bacterium]